MLIETPVQEQDIVSFKLVSGEEIIARIEKLSDDSYTVTKPFALVPSQQGLGLMPFVLSVALDAKLVINKTAVVCFSKTDKGLASQYMQQTTGIAMVSN